MKRENWTIAIDLGSSSYKLALFDASMALLFITSRPANPWRDGNKVEFDVNRMDKAIDEMLEELAAKFTSQLANIQQAGITGQRSTIVFWNKQHPLGPAISWQDRRTIDTLELFATQSDYIAEQTGLLLSPHYSASKLSWGLAHLHDVRKAFEAGELFCGPVSSYLIWRLSKGRIYRIDHTQAQRTLLMNLHTLKWDSKLCSLFSIPIALLPKLRPSQSDFGAMQVGTQAVPIKASIGDTQAACIAEQLGSSHRMVIQYGSGAFLAAYTGNKLQRCRSLLTSLFYSTNKKRSYFIEGTVNSAATLIEWLEKNSPAEHLPMQIVPTQIIPSLSGLGAPHWLAELPVTSIGKSKKFHPAKAAASAIGARLREIVDTLESNRYNIPKEIAVSGGLCHDAAFLEIQAHQLGRNLLQNAHEESALRGVAQLAANQLRFVAPTATSVTHKVLSDKKNAAVPTPHQWHRLVRQAKLHQLSLWFRDSLWEEKLSLMRPLLVGHRGAPRIAPENTLISLQTAISMRADGVEFDVRLSADAEPVLFHDLTLERTTDDRGKRRVQQLTVADLKQLDAGSWFSKHHRHTRIPTLAEVLHDLPKNILCYIEVKDEEGQPLLWQKVVELIDATKSRGRVALCSFNVIMARKLKLERPDLCVGGIFGSNMKRLHTAAGDFFADLDLLSFHYKHFRSDLLRTARLQQQILAVWTADPKSLQRHLIEKDVDVLITNVLPN